MCIIARFAICIKCNPASLGRVGRIRVYQVGVYLQPVAVRVSKWLYFPGFTCQYDEEQPLVPSPVTAFRENRGQTKSKYLFVGKI